MKSKFLFLAFLFISCATFGQATFGVKGGLNVSNIGGDASGVDSKIGFHVGGFVLIKPSEKFGVSPELVFSRQGAQAAASSSVKINYDYLNVPVMFNYYPTEHFFLQAGPQLGFLVSAKVKDGDGNSLDVKDQLNGIDFSLGFGLGADINNFIANARYNAGLTNTSESGDGSFPNSVFQISFGFKFQ